MVIRHNPSSFLNEQSKRHFPFNYQKGVALGQIMAHVEDNGTIGLQNLPALIQLLNAAIGDPNRVATAKWNICDIQEKLCELCQYYAEFQVNAINLDWNLSALQNALRMGQFKEMKDFCMYSNKPQELPPAVTIWQKWDHLICHRQAEKTTQTSGGGIGLVWVVWTCTSGVAMCGSAEAYWPAYPALGRPTSMSQAS